MHVDFLLERFATARDQEAIVWNGRSCTYAELIDLVHTMRAQIAQQDIRPGSVVSLEADFSPRSVAALLALIDHGCVIVPLTSAVGARTPEFRRIAEVERIVAIDPDETLSFASTGTRPSHRIITGLQAGPTPALVLFSSGSTGTSKAAVHNFLPLLEKFKVLRQSKRMLSFLLFDHIGGVNTLLYCLSNAGCLVTVNDRTPRAVLAAISRHRVQILPTSPTFLNLVLLSRAWDGLDLSSLELITYGTEPMPESTLQAMARTFPSVTLQQTYGLSELGILRSKSRANDSLWVKVGGEGFETRVVDGLLEIKARSAMLGYLNAPSPFTEDGWFKTGDAVEVDGEWLRILGRKSELINVGGEKVYPAEIESVLQSMEGVLSAVVSGEPNPLVGTMVKAVVRLATDETLESFRRRMRAHCKDRLAPFKVPQKVVLATSAQVTERFKKDRSAAR